MKIFKSVKIGLVYGIFTALLYITLSLTHSGADRSEFRDAAIIGTIFFIVGLISGVVIGTIYKIFYKLSGKEESYKLTWLVGLISGIIIALILIAPLILLNGGDGASILGALIIFPLFAMEFVANWLIPNSPESTRLIVGAFIGYPILNSLTSLLYEFFNRREQTPQI